MEFDSTIGERIKFMRTANGFKTASEAARAFGWTVSTYLGYENGDREPGKEMARRIAQAYGFELNYLLLGEGTIKRGNELFDTYIVGHVGSAFEIDAGLKVLPREGFCAVDTTIPTDDRYVAIEVTSESLWPRYEVGDLLMFNREGQDLSTIDDGFEAIVRLSNGRRFVKRIRRHGSPSSYSLESHNTPPMAGVDITWAARVDTIIRAANWTAREEKEEQRATRRARIAAAAGTGFFGEDETSEI